MGKAAIFNWSGGKDSALTLYQVLKSGQYDIKYLVTSCSEQYDRISMHGVRVSLLKRQAALIGIPLKIIYTPTMPTMDAYNDAMAKILTEFKNEGIEYSIYGDIFLADLRAYREEKLAEVGMTGVFPLWQRPTPQLVREFITLGFQSILVCIDERRLEAGYCGRLIDDQLLADLPEAVDPCGENGEFHSFVFDGPIFSSPVRFTVGEKVRRTYPMPKTEADQQSCTCCKTGETVFWYCDLVEEPIVAS
jgi:uncharacterized protein (TIGR00290 family)